MRPEQNSQYWLSSTQLEAKMLEYGIPKGLDSPRRVDPAHLFSRLVCWVILPLLSTGRNHISITTPS